MLERVKNFFFPASCITCGVLIDPASEDCLCKECKNRWELAKLATQSLFAGKAVVPLEIKGNSRTIESFIASIVNYRQASLEPKFNVQRNMIFKLKRYDYTRLTEFLANELADLIDEVTENAFDCESTVFFSMPRNPKNYLKTLNDSVKVITRLLANEYGCKYVDAFSKNIFAKEQKYLSSKERKENGARLKLDTKKLDNMKFKTAFIFDDMVTTASSVSEAARLLVDKTKVRQIYIFSITQNSEGLIRKMTNGKRRVPQMETASLFD